MIRFTALDKMCQQTINESQYNMHVQYASTVNGQITSFSFQVVLAVM